MLLQVGCVPSPRVNPVDIPPMALAQKNTLVSDAGGTSELMPAAATGADGDMTSPENLVQEYKELRERFQRPTTAPAAAAHHHKTPLSISNGYVEVLNSKKLGSLNDHQREVLHDMQ